MTRHKPTPGEVLVYHPDDLSPVLDGEMWLRGPLTDDEARTVAAAELAECGLAGTPGYVEQRRARCVPWRDGHDRGTAVMLGEGRGTFPVALVWIEHPPRARA